MTDTPTDTTVRPRDSETPPKDETTRERGKPRPKIDPAVAVPIAIIGLCLTITVAALSFYYLGTWAVIIIVALIAAFCAIGRALAKAMQKNPRSRISRLTRTGSSRYGRNSPRGSSRAGGLGGSRGRFGGRNSAGAGKSRTGRNGKKSVLGSRTTGTTGANKKSAKPGTGRAGGSPKTPRTRTPSAPRSRGTATGGPKKSAASGSRRSANLANARTPRRVTTNPNTAKRNHGEPKNWAAWIEKFRDSRHNCTPEPDNNELDNEELDNEELIAAEISPFATATKAVVADGHKKAVSLWDSWKQLSRDPDTGEPVAEPLYMPQNTQSENQLRGNISVINQFEQIAAGLPRAVDSQEAINHDALVPDYLEGFLKGFQHIQEATKMLDTKLSGRDGMCSAGNPAIETFGVIHENASACVSAIDQSIATLRRDPKMQDLLDRYESSNGSRGDVSTARIVGG